MLQRNLIYTAITRAKSKLVMLGSISDKCMTLPAYLPHSTRVSHTRPRKHALQPLYKCDMHTVCAESGLPHLLVSRTAATRSALPASLALTHHLVGDSSEFFTLHSDEIVLPDKSVMGLRRRHRGPATKRRPSTLFLGGYNASMGTLSADC